MVGTRHDPTKRARHGPEVGSGRVASSSSSGGSGALRSALQGALVGRAAVGRKRARVVGQGARQRQRRRDVHGVRHV
jgi:hypothetical protein